MKNPQRVLLALTCVVSLLAAVPVQAVTYRDFKVVSPTKCRPIGPGTLTSELTINSYGVFNPGATNESVICSLPADADVSWDSGGFAANVYVYFRAGAVSGKVSCTAYTGSTVVRLGATYAATYNPAFLAPGARGSFQILLADVSSGSAYDTAPPTNLVCTLTPKAALGMFLLTENVLTNFP